MNDSPENPLSPDLAEASGTTEKTLEPQPIVAKAGSYFRNARFLLGGLLVLFGGWCYYDGYVAWPARNVQIASLESRRTELQNTSPVDDQAVGMISAELQKIGDKKSDLSIRINEYLTVALPLFGAALVAWAMYKSRGQIRLENDVIHSPASPPVPLSAITDVDTALWDRKGIARINYKLADGTTGILVLDDFVYEQKPIDAMYDHVLSKLGKL